MHGVNGQVNYSRAKLRGPSGLGFGFDNTERVELRGCPWRRMKAILLILKKKKKKPNVYRLVLSWDAIKI